MKRSVLYSTLLAPAIALLPFGHATWASGVKIRHTIVAASGDAASSGGNYIFFLNARVSTPPEVVFDAFLGGPSHTGVFVGRGGMTSAIALGGNLDPTAGNFGLVMSPFITRDGNVVFVANGNSIFTSNRRQFVRLVQTGDPAPGGGTLSPDAATYAANDSGTIAYLSLVSDSTATQGIFRTDGVETVAIARNDIDPPTGGSFTALFVPVINNRGEVAFGAEMTGGGADFGIFRGDGGNLIPVFLAGYMAPGGGTFTDFGHPVINAHGQVAAVGLLTEDASRSGLFVGDGTSAVAIAIVGQSAPKGGYYGSRRPFSFHRLNDRGEVAFRAGLTDGTSSEGIFRGDGERTTAVALAGTVAPGTTGTFESFDDIELGNDGRIAFVASLAVGEGGVDFSNNVGIWVGTSEEDLHLIVRRGDVIGGKVLTGLPTSNNVGNQFDMNENGVVWIGSFQPSGTAVVFSSPMVVQN